MRRITLCADDFGYTLAASRGIAELIAQQRLSAVSCMVTSPKWPEVAKLLKPFLDSKLSIGLHFDLTSEFAEFSLSELLLKANLRLLDSRKIAIQLQQQLELFTSQLGKLPDHIDGHQHIHQLPVVSKELFKFYQHSLPNRPAIRYINPAFTPIKQLIITLASSWNFHRHLHELTIPHNSSFSGIYNFSPMVDYGQLFQKFLSASRDGGLIMCHPGVKPIVEEGDPIALSRVTEFNYLNSQQFLELKACLFAICSL